MTSVLRHGVIFPSYGTFPWSLSWFSRLPVCPHSLFLYVNQFLFGSIFFDGFILRVNICEGVKAAYARVFFYFSMCYTNDSFSSFFWEYILIKLDMPGLTLKLSARYPRHDEFIFDDPVGSQVFRLGLVGKIFPSWAHSHTQHTNS